MDDVAALHLRQLWRFAHREADLHLILLWGAALTFDMAMSHALGIDPNAGHVLRAAGTVDDIAGAFDNSGAQDLWDQFTGTTVDSYLNQFAHDQVGDTLDDYGIVPSINYDLRDDRTTRHIAEVQNRLTGTARGLWDSHVAPELIAGVEQGESIPSLADRLRGTVPETYSGRLETIARTEVIGASNSATNQVGDQFRLGRKAWLATGDERTRDSHWDQHGKYANDDGFFEMSSGALLEYPGDPNGPAAEVINCRCTVLWNPNNLRPAAVPAFSTLPIGAQVGVGLIGAWATHRAVANVRTLLKSGAATLKEIRTAPKIDIPVHDKNLPGDSVLPPTYRMRTAAQQRADRAAIRERFRTESSSSHKPYDPSKWEPDPPPPPRPPRPERGPNGEKYVYPDDVKVYAADPDRLVEVDQKIMVADAGVADDVIEQLPPGRRNLPPCLALPVKSLTASIPGQLSMFDDGMCRVLPSSADNIVELDAPEPFAYQRREIGKSHQEWARTEARGRATTDRDALLEWSDGQLDALPPRAADLVPEASTLVQQQLDRTLLRVTDMNDPIGWRQVNAYMRTGDYNLDAVQLPTPMGPRAYSGPINPAAIDGQLRDSVLNWHLAGKISHGRQAELTPWQAVSDYGQLTVHVANTLDLDLSDIHLTHLSGLSDEALIGKIRAAVFSADSPSVELTNLLGTFYKPEGDMLARVIRETIEDSATGNPIDFHKLLIKSGDEDLTTFVKSFDDYVEPAEPFNRVVRELQAVAPEGYRVHGALDADGMLVSEWGMSEVVAEFLEDMARDADSDLLERFLGHMADKHGERSWYVVARMFDDNAGWVENLTTVGNMSRLERIDLATSPLFEPGRGRGAAMTELWRKIPPFEDLSEMRASFTGERVARFDALVEEAFQAAPMDIGIGVLDNVLGSGGSFRSQTDIVGWSTADGGKIFAQNIGVAADSWDDIAELVGHSVRDDGMMMVTFDPDLLDFGRRSIDSKQFPIVFEIDIGAGRPFLNVTGMETVKIMPARQSLRIESFEVLVDPDGVEFGLVRATRTSDVALSAMPDAASVISKVVESRRPVVNWDGGIFETITGRQRPSAGPVIAVIKEKRDDVMSRIWARGTRDQVEASLDNRPGMSFYSTSGYRPMQDVIRGAGGDIRKAADGGFHNHSIPGGDGGGGGDDLVDELMEWALNNGIEITDLMEANGIDSLEAMVDEFYGYTSIQFATEFDSIPGVDWEDHFLTAWGENFHLADQLDQIYQHGDLTFADIVRAMKDIDAYDLLDDDDLRKAVRDAIGAKATMRQRQFARETIESLSGDFANIPPGMFADDVEYLRRQFAAGLGDVEDLTELIDALDAGTLEFTRKSGILNTVRDGDLVALDNYKGILADNDGDYVAATFDLLARIYADDADVVKTFVRPPDTYSFREAQFFSETILGPVFGIDEYDVSRLLYALNESPETGYNWLDLPSWNQDLEVDWNALPFSNDAEGAYELLSAIGETEQLWDKEFEWLEDFAHDNGFEAGSDVSRTAREFVEELLEEFGDAPESLAPDQRAFLFRGVRHGGNDLLGLDTSSLEAAVESAKRISGHLYIDPGFQSTSTRVGMATSWANNDLVMVVDIPQGTKVRGVDAIKGYNGHHEQEIILPPNTRAVIGDIIVFQVPGRDPQFLLHVRLLQDQPDIGGPAVAASEVVGGLVEADSGKLVEAMMDASMRNVVLTSSG